MYRSRLKRTPRVCVRLRVRERAAGRASIGTPGDVYRAPRIWRHNRGNRQSTGRYHYGRRTLALTRRTALAILAAFILLILCGIASYRQSAEIRTQSPSSIRM